MNTVNFSLYGVGYEDGLTPNLEAARQWLPGWFINIFHDGCLNGHDYGGDVGLIEINAPEGSGMFWRFLGAADAECAIFRDIDSLINPREAAATLAWVESGKTVHVMQDHPDHCYHCWGNVLGGMWGLRPAKLPYDFVALVEWWIEHKDTSRPGADMWFLNRYIWPYALCDGLLHLHPRSQLPADPWPEHEPITGCIGQRLFGPRAGVE